MGGLDAAATYLELSPEELRTRLGDGDTLAEIATAQGKTADGLKQAITDAITRELDERVAAGDLTEAEKARMLEDLPARLDAQLNASGEGRKGFFFHGHDDFPGARRRHAGGDDARRDDAGHCAAGVRHDHDDGLPVDLADRPAPFTGLRPGPPVAAVRGAVRSGPPRHAPGPRTVRCLMVTGWMRLGTRIAAGALLAVVAAGCGGVLGDDEDDSDSAGDAESTAASSESAAESTAAETSAKEATAPKVVPRNAVMAVGGVPRLTYRITDDSRVRETITVWRGKKRLAILVGKELTEAGRRTGVEPFTEAPWATKPERLRWCVRGIDEHDNRSKAVCAVLRVALEVPDRDRLDRGGGADLRGHGLRRDDGRGHEQRGHGGVGRHRLRVRDHRHRGHGRRLDRRVSAPRRGGRAALVAALAAAWTALPPPAGADVATVRLVVDGDTVVLQGGARVRLLQIDTPEVGGGECYSRAARRALLRLVPEGSTIRLEADPSLDARDRYGRLLRYVTRNGINVNLRLVANGSAAPYFYGGERGRWAAALLTAAQRAKRGRVGLWGACPRTRLDPERAIDTGPGTPPLRPATPAPGGGRCDSNYAGACVPVVPYDLDCADIGRPVTVVGTDIHNFDGDGDGNGRGCEAYG